MQFGDNNDGMCLFPMPGHKDRALMAINNEYTNYRYLFDHGKEPQSAEEVQKALAAEGVSVIEVQQKNGKWQFVEDSRYNRRIHGNTPINRELARQPGMTGSRRKPTKVAATSSGRSRTAPAARRRGART